MQTTLSIPFPEGATIGEQVREARAARRRRTATRRGLAAAFAAVMLAGTLGLLLRPDDSGWSLRASSTDGSSMTVSDASVKGATFTGRGIGQVTTPGLFAHGQKIAVFGGGEPRVVTADDSGRIRFSVDLSGAQPFSYPARPQAAANPSGLREANVTFLPVPNS